MSMNSYVRPDFDFSAPLEHVARMEPIRSTSSGYRSEFMRDRDRVMYCGSFRRLAGKTQIYLAGKDDNQRNRLTHTLEVSQIARTISHALNLDCDLTEAIALGHDLGHAPFGHAGEQILHEIMVPNSKIKITNSPLTAPEFSESSECSEPLFGFKHNIQSVRIAATIDDNYGECGLNLTNYTLWGILHHSSITYSKEKVDTLRLDPDYRKQYNKCYEIPGHPEKEAWSFEAFVVREADEIAQWHHDLEDALRGGAMTSNDVCKQIESYLRPFMHDEDAANLQKLKNKNRVNRMYITDLSRIVVNTLVNQLIECSSHNLRILWDKYVHDDTDKSNFFLEHSWQEEEIQSAIKLRKLDEVSSAAKKLEANYPTAIREKVHHSRDVERMNAKGQYIIKKLFQAYYSHPQQLLDSVIIRYMVDVGEYKSLRSAEQAGMGAVRVKFEKLLKDKNRYTIAAKIMLMRRICDHIAGMTDHYAIGEYNNLYG